MSFEIEKSNLDATCKAALREMKARGFDQADTVYMIDDQVIPWRVFDHLLRVGLVSDRRDTSDDAVSVLKNYGASRYFENHAEIGFQLRFNLS